jgi:hypothetical protein
VARAGLPASGRRLLPALDSGETDVIALQGVTPAPSLIERLEREGEYHLQAVYFGMKSGSVPEGETHRRH